MKLFKYKINSTVLIFNVLTLVLLVLEQLASSLDLIRPLVSEQMYVWIAIGVPVITTILRTTHVTGKPPIEKIGE